MKSPWSLIGWLLAALLALGLSLGLYYLGLALGWRAWSGPALLWLPLLAAAALSLALGYLARPQTPVAAPPPNPANPLAGQWAALKSGLGEGFWDLYLIVGGSDDPQESFVERALGEAEYRAAPAGPEGLTLWATGGRAWLRVPATLWSAAGAAPGGDWNHVAQLLPSFPGTLRGLIVLADPRAIQADPEGWGRLVARRLGGLPPGPARPWWLVLSPPEQSAGDAPRWPQPCGLFFPESSFSQNLPQAMVQAQKLVAGQLEGRLEYLDRRPEPPTAAADMFTLREEFSRLPLDVFSAAVAGVPGKKFCDGLFLIAPEAVAAPDFLQQYLPARLAEIEARGQRRRARRLLWLGLAAALVAVLGGLALGYGQGRRALGLAAEGFPLLTRLEQQPAGPPPVASLAAATDLTLGLETRAGGLASLYRAPQQAAEEARQRLAAQLRRRLPAGNTQAAPFTYALAQWAGQGIAAPRFEFLGESVNLPSFAAQAARERAARLVAQWNFLLGGSEANSLMNHYDRLVFAAWQQAAESGLAALSPGEEKLRALTEEGLRGQAAGLEFLRGAGGATAFQNESEAPHWIAAAKELALLESLNGRKPAAILRQLTERNAPLGADGLEKLIAASQALRHYETELYGLADLAATAQGLTLLAGEMFSGAAAPPERVSLIALRQSGTKALAALEATLPRAPEPERARFAGLFLSPVELLERGATMAAAAALEEEWRREIVLPSKDLPEAEKALLLLGEEGAVAAFRDGPARPYLEAGAKGYKPREAGGRKFPWSREFLAFINANQEGWRKAAASDGRLKLSARLRPVRAEGDRLSAHPLGVALEMLCGAERFAAETYNRPATFAASWSPQDCGPLTVSIAFRDFTLRKRYEGAAGFTRFVRAAVGGELRLGWDDFPEQRHLMRAVGAEAVAVSLDVERGGEILKALTAPPPALRPPTEIIGQ